MCENQQSLGIPNYGPWYFKISPGQKIADEMKKIHEFIANVLANNSIIEFQGNKKIEFINYGNTVSITGDGGDAWNYFGPSYKKLAPRLITYSTYASNLEKLNELKNDLEHYDEYLKFRNTIEDKYIESFFATRLKNLDIHELLNLLYEKFGNNIIFLCHEPIDEFCHRRLLADYIELKTGVYIPEIKQEGDKIIKLNPIRYKDKLKRFL